MAKTKSAKLVVSSGCTKQGPCVLCNDPTPELVGKAWKACPTGIKEIRKFAICENCGGAVYRLARPGEQELLTIEKRYEVKRDPVN